MAEYNSKFFAQVKDRKAPKPESVVNFDSLVKDKPLIQALITQITHFKNTFEGEAKQASPKDLVGLHAAIGRCKQGLEALDNLVKGRNISAEDGKILRHYIKTIHITGAYKPTNEEPTNDEPSSPKPGK